MKKVLFVAYGGGHVNMIVPVAQALMRRPGWEVHALGLTTAAPVLAKAGIPHFGFRDLVRPGDETALEWGRRLSAGVSSDLVPAEETIAYMGLSYVDLEAAHGVEGAARIYGERGRHAFLPLGALERALRKVQPDVVVTTNSPRAERAALFAARRLGIPSLCLLDLYAPEDGSGVGESGYGDRVCVLSEDAKDNLVGFGRDPGDIIATGNPAFDRHYLYRPDPSARRFGPGDTVVGLASNVLPGLPDGALQRAVFERLHALCERKGYRMAVRQHPNEAPWPDVGNGVQCNDMPIEAYLGSLDMLVTFPSTIALEAQIHKVAVALLDFTSLSQGCSYLFRGQFDYIKSVAEIDRLTAHPAVRRDLGVPAVSATAKVCDAIIKMTEETN